MLKNKFKNYYNSSTNTALQLLPGIESFEVNSCRGYNLLPDFQLFTKGLDDWKQVLSNQK